MARYGYYKERNVSGLGKRLNSYLARNVAREVQALIHHGAAIVEIGAGEGRIADLLRKDHSYCCYEPSPSLARALREKGVTVREACAPPLLEPDCSQQAVIALHVLEHVRDGNEALHFFAEASRVLAPGGIFFVISPDYNDMGKLFFDVDYTHGYVTTPNRLSQLARDAGFVIDKRKFLYGAVPAFPGLLLNLIVKALFFFSRCLRENTCFEIRGIAKLEYLFSRAVVFICRKPVSATAK